MIKCAAIKYPSGNIYTGKYHGKCFEAAHEAGEDNDRGQVVQGFLTDKDEFMNRKRALVEAMECDQVEELHSAYLGLMSEDLKICPSQ